MIISVAAIFAAFMVYVLLTILFATAKVITRVIKRRLTLDMRSVSVFSEIHIV